MTHEFTAAHAARYQAINQMIVVLAASATQGIQSFEVDWHIVLSLFYLLAGVPRIIRLYCLKQRLVIHVPDVLEDSTDQRIPEHHHTGK